MTASMLFTREYSWGNRTGIDQCLHLNVMHLVGNKMVIFTCQDQYVLRHEARVQVLLAEAEEICREVNQQQPIVESLLLEAKIKRENKDFNAAIELLTAAQNTLEGHELIWK